MSQQDTYDLVILGSGSTAFAAVTCARDLGKTAVMTAAVRVKSGTSLFTWCAFDTILFPPLLEGWLPILDTSACVEPADPSGRTQP
jgi:hypothetical protein